MKKGKYALILLISAFLTAVSLSSCKWLFPPKEETKEYSVVFVFNNGQNDVAKLFKEGEEILPPSDPERDSHIFDGWYYDDTFSNQFKQGDTADGDKKLYAKYIRIYNITGAVYAGDWTPLPSAGNLTGLGSYMDGQLVNLSFTPSAGYILEGWYRNGVRITDYTGDDNAASFVTFRAGGDAVYSVKVSSGVVLQLSYSGAHGGDLLANGRENASYTVLQGESVAVKAAHYTIGALTGYVFEGWYIRGTGSLYTLDSEFSVVMNSNLHFDAKYSYKQFTASVSVNDQGRGTASITLPSNPLNIEQSLGLRAESLNAGSYVFAGYYLNGVLLSYTADCSVSVERLFVLSGGAMSFAITAEFKVYTDPSIFLTELENGKIKITGLTGSVASEIFVPSQIGGVPVEIISANVFRGRSDVRSVYLPASLKSFEGNGNPFLGCTGLAYITVDSNNPKYKSDGCGVLYERAQSGSGYSSDTLKLIAYPAANTAAEFVISPEVAEIQTSAFHGSVYLREVTGGGQLSYIGIFAFRNAISLAELKLHSSAPSFVADEFAFMSADKLASVELILNGISAANQAVIRSWVFSGCSELSSVVLTGIKVLNAQAFSACSSLISITLPASLREFNGDVFYNTALESVYAEPSSYFESFDGALYGKNTNILIYCPEKKTGSVTVKSGTIAVADYAFRNCKSVTAVYMPSSGLTSIGKDAFYGCSALVTAELGNSLTVIKAYGFYGCSALAAISLPAAFTTLSEHAFENCTSLASVNLGGLVTAHFTSFDNCSALPSLYVPSTVTNLGDIIEQTVNGSVSKLGGELPLFRGCSGLTSISVAAENPTYFSQDGVLYSIKGQRGAELLVRYPEAKTGSFTVRQPILKIANYAFYAAKITSLWFNFPIELTDPPLLYIGNGAFYNSSLTRIALPYSVTDIGNEAFYGCFALSNLTLSENLKVIGSFAFAGCALEVLDIPINVKTIHVYAFADNANLKRVNLTPSTPPSLGSYAGSSRIFEGHNAVFEIYVPNGKLNAYKTASLWTEYKNYMLAQTA